MRTTSCYIAVTYRDMSVLAEPLPLMGMSPGYYRTLVTN